MSIKCGPIFVLYLKQAFVSTVIVSVKVVAFVPVLNEA